jgi:hypothetical protein
MDNFNEIKNLHNKINSLLLDIKEIKSDLYEEYSNILNDSTMEFVNLGAKYINDNPQEFQIFLNKLRDIIKILNFIKTKENIREIIQEQKRDRCLRIADRKFDKPSAYKSGAVVRCRKGDIWKGLKENWQDTSWENEKGQKVTLPQLLDAIKNYPTVSAPIEKIQKIVIKKDSGGIETPRLDKADIKYPVIIVVDDSNNFKYILDGNHRAQKAIAAGLKSIPAKLVNIKKLPKEFQDVLSEAKKETLRTWFKRSGPKGKEGGWVDCNTCKDGSCKACGRKKGEKRSKYPSCRPTPAQCKDKGKGTKWGKTK